MIKKFYQFNESKSSSVNIDEETSRIIRNTPEISNLVSSNDIEIRDNKIFYDESNSEVIELIKIHLGIDVPNTKK